MDPSDLTIEILKGIRDEIRGTNVRVDQTNARLDQTNARLKELSENVDVRFENVDVRLESAARRQTEVETRLATEIVAVAGAVREVRDLLRENVTLSLRVDDHEQRLRSIEAPAGTRGRRPRPRR